MASGHRKPGTNCIQRIARGIKKDVFAVSDTGAHAAWIIQEGESAGNIKEIDFIGIAANNSIGVTSVLRWDASSNSVINKECNSNIKSSDVDLKT